MAENNNKEQAAKKAKRPTAKKRDLQSLKQRAQNRSFKASIATSIRSFKEAASKNEKQEAQDKLNQVYSLLDKGVKKRIFKLNKVNRMKAQAAQLLTR